MTTIASAVAEEDQAVSLEPHFANDVVRSSIGSAAIRRGVMARQKAKMGFGCRCSGLIGGRLRCIDAGSRGRRVVPAIPEQSLLLKKISGVSPHGGGIRIPRDSAEYEVLRSWIAAGVPIGRADAPHVASIRIEPAERIMSFRDSQQLKVVAVYSDGHERDVTRHARFQSNREAVADVDERGLVTVKDTAGDVAVMAAYLESIAVFSALVPRNDAGEWWVASKRLPHSSLTGWWIPN